MRQALEGDVAVWACGWQGHAKGLQWCDQAGQLPRMPLAGEPAKSCWARAGEIWKSSYAIILLTLGKTRKGGGHVKPT